MQKLNLLLLLSFITVIDLNEIYECNMMNEMLNTMCEVRYRQNYLNLA